MSLKKNVNWQKSSCSSYLITSHGFQRSSWICRVLFVYRMNGACVLLRMPPQYAHYHWGAPVRHSLCTPLPPKASGQVCLGHSPFSLLPSLRLRGCRGGCLNSLPLSGMPQLYGTSSGSHDCIFLPWGIQKACLWEGGSRGMSLSGQQKLNPHLQAVRSLNTLCIRRGASASVRTRGL